MQALQLPLGAIEGIAQSGIDIPVTRAVDMKTVGMDLGTGHGQVNLDGVARTAVTAILRTFERHVTTRNPPSEAFQSRPEGARPVFECS
jgi:hypothetical protein